MLSKIWFSILKILCIALVWFASRIINAENKNSEQRTKKTSKAIILTVNFNFCKRNKIVIMLSGQTRADIRISFATWSQWSKSQMERNIEKRRTSTFKANDQIKFEFRLFFSECSLTVSRNFYYHQSCSELSGQNWR